MPELRLTMLKPGSQPCAPSRFVTARFGRGAGAISIQIERARVTAKMQARDSGPRRMDVEFHRRQTNGIRLFCAEAGPADGPLVFLLHGFPEFWYGWRHQIGPLARAGYHVVAPDQRGYDESDKPRGVAAYDLDVLAADIAGLADTFGRERFAIVGHDWGALVGWWTARNCPARVERLAALNAPHPAVWKHAMRHNEEQKKLSRYVGTIGMPILPELIIRAGGYRSLVDALRGAHPADAFSDADIAKYRAAWKKPGALTAMLNWYRALLRKDIRLEGQPRLAMPIRIIWGVGDVYAVPELASESARLCEEAKILYLENATHWVAHDEPERVTRALLEFLGQELKTG
jgi:pimeloyl-ACP methyl ester carboxylesterase